MRALLRSLRRDRAALVGAIYLAALAICAIVGPVVIPVSPFSQSLEHRLDPPTYSLRPYDYPLGADGLGRDVLARILYGARVSLVLGLLSVVVGGVVGSLLGLIAGYLRGLADELIMRLADAQLSIPFVLLTLTLVGAVGPSERNLVIVLGLSSWISYGRIVRSRVLSLREMEFVEAARSLGATHIQILSRHLVPNVLPTTVLVGSLELSSIVLAEAALSFLGVGVPPPTPTWGNMLGDARDYMISAPWLMTWPGLALTVTIVSLNAVANWLRDALDPRTRRA